MSYFLGIDMGGTNFRLGVVSSEAEILWTKKFQTRSDENRSGMLELIRSAIREALAFAKEKQIFLEAIGAGVPGCVDFERGFIHTLVNVPGWDEVFFARFLNDVSNLPSFVDNDVNVMALGEHRFGSARKDQNVICITLGTGVGGGIILNGELYRGSSFTAGEIGHVAVEKEGPYCNCGSRGCLERFIGNRYMIERSLFLYRQANVSKEDVTPENLEKWAYAGDVIAIQVWREIAAYLGMVLAGIVNVFNPDSIIIGGGIARAGKILFDEVESIVRERAMQVPAKHVQIRPAKLGADAGLIGAATLAMEGIKSAK